MTRQSSPCLRGKRLYGVVAKAAHEGSVGPAGAASVAAMMPPLVGRTHEAGVLSAALDDLLAGQGGFVHIIGEAGIGKSRMIDDFSRDVGLRNVSLRAVCADETDRLRPWSTLRALLPGFDPTVRDPTEAALQLAELAAGDGPLAITADDAQWADSDSLAFLRILVRRAPMIPILVVVAARPHLLDHAGRQLGDFAAKHGLQLALQPLGEPEVQEFVRAWIGDLERPELERPELERPELVRSVHGAGGNPFLLAEVLRAGSRQCADTSGQRRDSADDVGSGHLDQDVVHRVMSRILSDMDPRDEVLLRVAAALPDGFGCDELAILASRSLDDTIMWVLTQTHAGVLVDHARGLAFRHTLLRDVVRVSTPAAVAVVLRRTALDLLCHDDSAVDSAVLMLLDGFDPTSRAEVDRAVDLGLRLSSKHPAACADLLQVALPNLAPADQRRARAVAELGWSLVASGRAGEVTMLLRTHYGDRPSQMPVMLLALEGSALAISGRVDLALERYAGYTVADIEREFETDDPAVVDAVAELASGWVSTGNLRGGLALVDWVEQSDTASSPTRTASVEATRAMFCGLTGKFTDSIGHARMSLAAIERGSGAIVTPASPVISIALALDLQGDSDGALAALRDRHLPGVIPAWTEPLFQFASTIVLYRRGDWDDALNAANAGLVAAEEVGLRLSVFWPYAVSSLIHLARNQRNQAADWLAGGSDMAGSSSVGTEWLTYAGALAQAANGDVSAAHATLKEVCDFLIAAELDALLLGFGPETARLGVSLGLQPSLGGLLKGLDRLVTTSASPVALATRDLVGGFVVDDANALRSASEQFAVLNRLPDAARAAADAAVAFQRAGETANSRQMAGVAFAGFDRLGAELLHAQLRSELRDAGLSVRPRRSPSRPVDGWDSLTPSEATVVRLVGEGLMNAEIADRLFVSRRTVESHLSRVFVKVGVTSRTQLMAGLRRSVSPGLTSADVKT